MRRNMLLALAGATVLLAALAGAASARNLSVTNQNLRATFREARFALPFGTSNCQITMEGSFHTRTLQKVVGTLAGFVTRMALGPCASGTASLLTETLPWHVRYSGFTGTLPNITELRATVINASFRVRGSEGITCLARTTAAEPMTMNATREAGGVITGAIMSGSVRTGAECFGATGSFTSDRGPVTVLSSTTRITLTLI